MSTEASQLKRERWQQRLTAWKASAMTQAAYCRERSLSRHEFVYWKRRLLPNGSKSTPKFVAIPVRRGGGMQPAETTRSLLTLVIGTRYRLEIPPETAGEELQTVLDVLEARG